MGRDGRRAGRAARQSCSRVEEIWMTDSNAVEATPRPKKRATKPKADKPATTAKASAKAKSTSRVEAAAEATKPPPSPPPHQAQTGSAASAAVSLDFLSPTQRESLEQLSL